MWIDIIGAALLHSTWQFSLMGLALYIALQIIPNDASQKRYAASCLALLGCMVLFLGTMVWAVPDTSIAMTLYSTATPPKVEPISVIVTAWVLGVAAILLYNVMSLFQIYRLKSSFRQDIPHELSMSFRILCGKIGVPSSVNLQLSDAIKVPCTFGTFKPIVLLPLELLTRLSSDEIEAILAHELAHIRRYDYLANIVQQTILSVLYYHPVVHFISREIDREREIACDDIASKLTQHPRALACALGKVALFAHKPVMTPRLAISALGRDTKDVTHRMARLITPNQNPGRNFAKMIGMGFTAIAVVIFANLTLAFASGTVPQLSKSEAKGLRDAICSQIKTDGYYMRRDFSKNHMVRVDLNAENITLNGITVPDAKIPQYTKIIDQYGLKLGHGQYIYFNSLGDDIELGTDMQSSS